MEASIIVGFVTSVLFHPYDRALYLSMANHRPFLMKENFHNMFHGLRYSIGHRLIGNSCYFMLQSHIENKVVIGFTNGVISHVLGTIKMRIWENNKVSLRNPRVFTGLPFTIGRDVVFAVVYENLRSDNPVYNIVVASLASALSSPLNYLKVNAISEKPRQFHIKNLGIGPGTLRVGLGMAFSQYLFDYCNSIFKKQNQE
jgi:hypothetical protein